MLSGALVCIMTPRWRADGAARQEDIDMFARLIAATRVDCPMHCGRQTWPTVDARTRLSGRAVFPRLSRCLLAASVSVSPSLILCFVSMSLSLSLCPRCLSLSRCLLAVSVSVSPSLILCFVSMSYSLSYCPRCLSLSRCLLAVSVSVSTSLILCVCLALFLCLTVLGVSLCLAVLCLFHCHHICMSCYLCDCVLFSLFLSPWLSGRAVFPFLSRCLLAVSVSVSLSLSLSHCPRRCHGSSSYILFVSLSPYVIF